MTYQERIHCPPYVPPAPADIDHAGKPITSILALASRASDATNRYRDAMECHADMMLTLRLAGAMAAATEALTQAIADNVATGDASLI